MAQLQQNVPLGLLNGEHRTDRFASLGHRGIQHPVAADGDPDNAFADGVALQQRAVGSRMGRGDPSEACNGREGVVHAADEVVDVAAGRIDQHHQRPESAGLQAEPALPGFVRAIGVGERLRVDGKGLQRGPRQCQEGDAERRSLFQLPGLVVGVGSDDAAPDAPQPLLCVQVALQERQQPGEVAGEMAGDKDKGQIGGSPTQACTDVPNGCVQGIVA